MHSNLSSLPSILFDRIPPSLKARGASYERALFFHKKDHIGMFRKVNKNHKTTYFSDKWRAKKRYEWNVGIFPYRDRKLPSNTMPPPSANVYLAVLLERTKIATTTTTNNEKETSFTTMLIRSWGGFLCIEINFSRRAKIKVRNYWSSWSLDRAGQHRPRRNRGSHVYMKAIYLDDGGDI